MNSVRRSRLESILPIVVLLYQCPMMICFCWSPYQTTPHPLKIKNHRNELIENSSTLSRKTYSQLCARKPPSSAKRGKSIEDRKQKNTALLRVAENSGNSREQRRPSRTSFDEIGIVGGLTSQMLRHDILSREEEIRLGRAIVKAKIIRDKITHLLQ